MSRLLILLLVLCTGSPLLADEAKRFEQAAFPATYSFDAETLQRKNQAVLVYLWVDVYAAAFYTPGDTSPAKAVENQASQRLELYYFRAIDRNDVIKAAWATLQRQHAPATLQRLRAELDALHATFRDIKPGDRYSLSHSSRNGLSLELNGETVYQSNNPELARAYLGIWLAPDGLSDTLRGTLLSDH